MTTSNSYRHRYRPTEVNVRTCPPRADRGVGLHAGGILRRSGDDVDAAEERVDAVGRGVGASTHFNSFDIFQSDWHAQPVYVCEADPVGGSSVNLNLQPTLFVLGRTVVGCHRIGASPMTNNHTRYQPECLYQVHDTEISDHVACNDGGCPGNPKLGLAQSGCGQHFGNFAVFAFQAKQAGHEVGGFQSVPGPSQATAQR